MARETNAAGLLPLKYEGGKLLLVDQRKLPQALEYFDASSFEAICFAIKNMVVRGAPSIGVAAAFGFAMEAARRFGDQSGSDNPAGFNGLNGSDYSDTSDSPANTNSHKNTNIVGAHRDAPAGGSRAAPTTYLSLPPGSLADGEAWQKELLSIKEQLDSTRPTAVNLAWATERMLLFLQALFGSFCTTTAGGDKDRRISTAEFKTQAIAEAQRILSEHIETNKAISNYGSALIPASASIITHCNAGSLAACGHGTALGVIRNAHFAGAAPHVYVNETRPLYQGARLTMWELQQDDIDCTLICDSMSAHIMKTGKIDLVIVGADRIAANGDTANKIGTYNLAIAANYHNIPFYVAAPLSTFDSTIDNGTQIPIEKRDPEEILNLTGVHNAKINGEAYNPAFDVTPNKLIAGIITEVGILRPPFTDAIRGVLKQKSISSNGPIPIVIDSDSQSGRNALCKEN